MLDTIKEATNKPKIKTQQVENKLYIFVRHDLPWSVRLVQAAHVVSSFAIKSYDKLNFNWGSFGPNFVVYQVKDKEQLEKVLQQTPGSFSFREPDLNYEVTAACYYGPCLDSFEDFHLL